MSLQQVGTRPSLEIAMSRTLLAALIALSILAAAWRLTATQPAAPPSPADVRAFGARGDGKTDDTAAIQKAIDSGDGSIRFPRGTFRLTRSVVIDLDKVGPIAVVGDGTARVVMA